MDAIKKKMQSLKTETDTLYSQIQAYEEETRQANEKASQCEGDIREISKRICQSLSNTDAALPFLRTSVLCIK